MSDAWNRCDACGKFIAFDDFISGTAIHKLDTPESLVTNETFVTLCKDHRDQSEGDKT
jgi:hypothetical protein